MAKANLTARYLDKLTAKTCSYEIYDTVCSGLSIIVHPTSKKVWVWRGRIRGELKKFTLGSYGIHSVKDARRWAYAITEDRDRNKLIRSGHEQIKNQVSDAKISSTPDVSVRQLFEIYMEAEGNKLRSAKHRRALFYRHIDNAIGARDVNELRYDDVADLLDNLLKFSVSQARHVRTIVRRIFRWAETRGRRKVTIAANPISDIFAIQPEQSRQRYLDDWELSILLKVLLSDRSDFAAGLYLILHTGVRRGEAYGASWDELDFDRGIWLIPASRTKTAVELVLPLPSGLLRWLDRRKSLRKDGSSLLFSGRITSKPFTGFSEALARVQKELLCRSEEIGKTVSHWTIHDIRRSVASGMHSLIDDNYQPKIQPEVVERILNHSQPSVSRIYNRYDYFAQKRHALILWEQHLLSMLDSQSW